MKKLLRYFSLACITLLSLIYFENISSNTYIQENNIPPRLQWNANQGYCGEVALISAGLYYGQYMSQYTARAIALKNKPQTSGQLLLGVNAKYAASKMHLKSIQWKTAKEKNTNEFLAWVKHNVAKGYPVIIGIYTNEYLFYGKQNPDAGDPLYDHIVPVFGFSSKFPLNSKYHGKDIIYFSDNGLWSNPKNPPFLFHYTCNNFQANRQQANAKNGSIYSLADGGINYGIAITGVIDFNNDTLPVRVQTNVNYQKPSIKNHSNHEPSAMPLVLKITVSNLKPCVLYNLYKYNNIGSVPNSRFNANASSAIRKWPIKINSGSSITIIDNINSNDVAIYRAVKATAP
jgi:hypothetical protein